MSTIDLSNPTPAAPGLLDGLPRRVALTLAELRAAARLAGGAPLPFEVTAPKTGALEDRLGVSRAGTDDAAYLATLETLHDPEDSLARRGLLTGGDLDPGLAGAVGLLATPALALDADVRVGPVQAKAWHRCRDQAVATLATVDGIVFELAWYDVPQWPSELARIAAVPEDVHLGNSRVPTLVDLPFELVSAAAEAHRSGRGDLVDVLVSTYVDGVIGADGDPLSATEVSLLLGALDDEVVGRLRVLVTTLPFNAALDGPVDDGEPEARASEDGSVVGVASWVLVGDGWRAFRPHETGGEPRVEIRSVRPEDLAAELAPVLAVVTR